MTTTRIALIGDYNGSVTAHQAIPRALKLASDTFAKPVEWTWIGTDTIAQDVAAQLAPYDGIWCVPASPYASFEGALRAIRFARESGRAFLGTCGGCQHALLEYARNVLGLKEADHAESNPDATLPLIAPLDCALVEISAKIFLENGSRLQTIYGQTEIEETYHCSYGLNRQFETQLMAADLRVSGRDLSGEVRAVELVTHPFFICTLFQPERAALKELAHPLINAFVSAAMAKKQVAA
jgi:CTP synthase (UTP-ammonia lyase)